MPARKRTPEAVWQLTFDIFYLKMSLVKAAKLNNLSKKTAQIALKDAIDYGYISSDQYKEYVRTAFSRGLDAQAAMYTQQELALKYSDMGKKSAAGGLERLTEQARKGGLSTQAKHGAKVGKNLHKAKPYGSTACKYNDVWFASQGERITALLLKSYGLLDSFVEGENFQKEFGRIRVDFYINDKLIVEYHPIPKQKFKNVDFEVASSIETYLINRTEALKNHFQGKIIVIPAPSGTFSATEFYNKLSEIGITDSWSGFLEKCREVKKDILLADKQYELELYKPTSDDEVPF